MTRALGYGASGAYASSNCHYCGRHAGTSDHVVPRGAFRMHQSALPYWFRQHNIVPACDRCNNVKDVYRSDCSCPQCDWVWVTFHAFAADWLRPGYVERLKRVIKIAQSRRD